MKPQCPCCTQRQS